MSDDRYYGAIQDEEKRPLCDECRTEHALIEWEGRLLCSDCLEEEFETDPALN